MEEAEVKAKECPICFHPMVSELRNCYQCNQVFHSRSNKSHAHQGVLFFQCPLRNTLLHIICTFINQTTLFICSDSKNPLLLKVFSVQVLERVVQVQEVAPRGCRVSSLQDLTHEVIFVAGFHTSSDCPFCDLSIYVSITCPFVICQYIIHIISPWIRKQYLSCGLCIALVASHWHWLGPVLYSHECWTVL